jgi:glycosyltransferase involved in cell wall biosynthesis
VRVALIGTRGPGSYGGFETCVAEIAPRLAALGHDVIVYARKGFAEGGPRDGTHVVVLRSIGTKNLDTITHTAVTTLHLARHRVDAVICFGVGNSPFAWLIRRVLRIPVVLNVDGLDRSRAKWGRFARWYLSVAERISVRAANELVTDALTIQRYYVDRYSRASTFIPYGAPAGPVTSTTALKQFGLEPGGYVLYVSRLEPENHPEVAIEAHRRSGVTLPLVVVGGSRYEPEFEQQLRDSAGPGVVFTGFVFGDGYVELQSHAALYLQCTEIGGTHPALVEAMGFGNAIVALDTPEHREVLGDAGHYYRSVEDLAAELMHLLGDPTAREELRAAASERARSTFSWDRDAAAYATACEHVTVARRGT